MPYNKDYDDWDAEDFENEVDEYANRFDEDVLDRRMAELDRIAMEEAREKRERERECYEEDEPERDPRDENRAEMVFRQNIANESDDDIIPF